MQVLDEYMEAVENADDEWNDLRGTEWIDLPFELQCTDAVLHTVSSFRTLLLDGRCFAWRLPLGGVLTYSFS